MGSSIKTAAVRAKRKSSCVVRQSDTEAGGVVGCYGNRTDKKQEELKSSSTSAVTSLRELELAAAAGRSSNAKLDDVKARLTP